MRPSKTITNLILHLHPASIPTDVLKFNRTFGLGGIAALLLVIQVVTGLMLRFYYVPYPGEAYNSVLSIMYEVSFGSLIRNMHYWSAALMLVVVILHLFRTFYTEAFHGARHNNWLIGLGLLILVIFSNFTGYLLPWDQLAYWAITVSTSMIGYFPVVGEWIAESIKGGQEITGSALINFYTLHTGVFPAAIVILMSYHFWKVRKAGGVVVPADVQKKFVPTIPNLVQREFVVALVSLAVIILLSIFFNAPLKEIANPAFSPNPAKAPWYFMGIQELVMHFHPLLAVYVIPIILLTGLVWIPYFNYTEDYSGKWFATAKGKKLVVNAAFIALIVVPLLVIIDEYWNPFSELPALVGNGLIPFLIVAALFGFYYYILKIKIKANKNETVQAMFTLLAVSMIILTLIGVFFRGEGMRLMFYFG
ncbi:MAG TPA: cytochrome b N-terminal domain-containing protein [Bacteroidales bacterium]